MRKITGYDGADTRDWICRSFAERIFRVWHGVKRTFVSGKNRGLSRSGYPPLTTARVIAERMSVARMFSWGGLSSSVEQTAHTAAFPHGALWQVIPYMIRFSAFAVLHVVPQILVSHNFFQRPFLHAVMSPSYVRKDTMRVSTASSLP